MDLNMGLFQKKQFSEHPWNLKLLKPPDFKFCEVSNSQPKVNIIKPLINELSLNSTRSQLFCENIIIKKFMYLRKNKYRTDKGFSVIPKIIKVVKTIQELDLETTAHRIKCNIKQNFVPSKQVLQWFLIKCQSYAKLLSRLNACSAYSGKMLYHRFRSGHSWIEVLTVFAMISKIWTISKLLLKNICSTYKQLYIRLDELPLNEMENDWNLDYTFPPDLSTWLEEGTEENERQKNLICGEIERITTLKQLVKFLATENKKRKIGNPSFSMHITAIQWNKFIKRAKKQIADMKNVKKEFRIKMMNVFKEKMYQLVTHL